MKYNIVIKPSGVHYKSEENLLDDALSQSITLEHSCKTGDCGVCSAEVISGVVENEHGELVTSGVVLACQSRAKEDSVLKANYYPELARIKQKTLPCKVVSFEYVTDDIIAIKLRFPPTAEFDYLPGQYVDLSFKGIKRSYSIANAQSKDNILELHIRKVVNGQMSKLIFGQIKENQLMRIEGPKGTFFLRSNSLPLILIATGTGIAPVKAIVEELIANNDQRKVHIYWGMQYAKEIYCDELIKLISSHNHITFTPVLSREIGQEAQYRRGYVQHVVVQDFKSLDGFQVYACGSLKMIEDAKSLFLANNLSGQNFFSDAFTPAK